MISYAEFYSHPRGGFDDPRPETQIGIFHCNFAKS